MVWGLVHVLATSLCVSVHRDSQPQAQLSGTLMWPSELLGAAERCSFQSLEALECTRAGSGQRHWSLVCSQVP